MPVMLLSNPGLPLAIYGNPRTKKVRRARRSTSSKGSTMARRRKHSRRRKNPLVKDYISAARSAPGSVLALFKGSNKGKNLAFAAGGAVGTYVLGGLLTSFVITPALNKVPAVASVVANPIAKRVMGGLIPFTAGFVASRFVKGDLGKALLVGGTIAGLTEIAMPGMVGQLIGRIPGVGQTIVGIAAKAPSAAGQPKAVAAAVQGPVKGLSGLGEYVDAASYQGTGEYVDAASYQGTGDDTLMLAGPDDDALADDDSAMAGYLTDKPYLEQPSYMDG